MKKEDESYESVNLPNTEARLAPLLYIFRIYHLIKSISGKQKKIDFGQVRARLDDVM